ncbi:hypothetical protein ACVWXU_003281 [Streptomyces sp. TE33382]
MKPVASPTARARTPATAILLKRNVPRWGTAASEVRIMPELYSVPTTSTPKTTIASWPRIMPEKLTKVGSKVARSTSVRLSNWAFITAQSAAPIATVTPNAQISVQVVEETVRILVHSAFRTAGTDAIVVTPPCRRGKRPGRPAGSTARPSPHPPEAAAPRPVRSARGTPRSPRSSA